MNVKKDSNPIEKIQEILKNQNGILLTADLAKANIPRSYLSILLEKGKIERVKRGVYIARNSIEDDMYIFQATYSASIFSHETALFLHDLTDRSPLFFTITVPVGYHAVSLKQSKHKIYYLNRDLFDLGVISMNTYHGNEVRATNLERTICDIIRSRNQIEPQFVNEALKKYVKNSQRNVNQLFAYAKLFRIQRIMRETIELLS